VTPGGWEALSGDPLPWLLDNSRPNLLWRALVELVRRPVDSPAVRRAKSGASAVEPAASLLRDLHPDGRWNVRTARWTPYSGPGWRLVAAAAFGADPDDPRLQAAARLMLESETGYGGFSLGTGRAPSPWLTARALEALAGLGWCRHPRFQEGLAWLEEGADWGRGTGARTTTAVAVLATLTACREQRRAPLLDRAVAELQKALASRVRRDLKVLGHPNFRRTDLAEILWAMALAELPLEPAARPALRRLQQLQVEGGRWRRTAALPSSLPLAEDARPAVDLPSRWVTLRAAVAILHYAAEADLPRHFPTKPSYLER